MSLLHLKLGSFLQVTDAEIMKESKPSIYLKKILPILLKNSVVHFIGFGNRLAFDPIPFELQVCCLQDFLYLLFIIYYRANFTSISNLT